ncbi:MAG TPA: 4-aminobutyrate--2-oxoglutarate transaminase [Candidatus Dormibacteraeota bacterium]
MSPSNEELNQRRQRAVARGVSNSHPVFAAQAEGARLTDVDGREYIDFAGGIGVLNVGHGDPRVLQAVHAQLDRFTHTCFQVVMYEDYIRLAERLNALVPGEGARKTLLLTTGAEAVENAVKIARSATGRPAVIAFTGSFHGRTLLAMTLTGKISPYRQDFGPFAPEVYHAPYPYEYRGWTTERALAAFDELLETQVAPDHVAAVIIEPVLGEGGFVPAPPEYLRELRRRTSAHGILLIADEIQTGFGRTGRMLAIEHSGVVPDLVVLAKSLAGGLPLAAVVGRADVMDAPSPGGLGGTYAGNPLACAAANAVLDRFEQGDLMERAARLGARLTEGFAALQARHPAVGDVRGLGPMVAMELVRDRQTREPDAALTGRVLESAREQGLLLVRAGLHGNVVRALAPLTIDESEVARALEILDAALSGVPAVAAPSR